MSDHKPMTIKPVNFNAKMDTCLRDYNNAQDELRRVQHDVEAIKGNIIELLVKERRFDCFSLNMNKVRQEFS